MGNNRVGLAVRESIVAGMNKGDVAVECISARLMKVCIQLKEKYTVCLSLSAILPLSTRTPAKMIIFGVNLTRWSIKGVPSRDHLFVLMDANARAGMRRIVWNDSRVLGANERDELSDNEEGLLTHATDNKLALLNTYYATPAQGISYTFQSPN